VGIDLEGPLYFDPPNCKISSSFVIPAIAAPIIAIVGVEGSLNSVMNQTVLYLEAIHTWQKLHGQFTHVEF